MSYEPLHHKYRPKSFAELVGQEAIASTLTNAISTSRIAPAYLFTGPRGTGKTSSARILAKSLNCLNSPQPTATPCGVCDVCQGITKGYSIDVIEIDAASNTGVDNIREIIERSQFAPVQCRYKVYAIDECLTGDSLVLTSEGVVRIDDSKIIGKKVLSYNDSTGDWEYKKVVRWFDQGDRQTLVIKTTNGKIRCTGNHLIRTDTGWIRARDVKEGMRILSPANAVVEPSFSNLVSMDASEDLLKGTSSKVIPTGKKHITLKKSWNKLNNFVPFVLADAEKSLIYQNFYSKKAKDLAALSPTGKDTHTKKDTAFGNLEQSIFLPMPKNYHQKHWELSTEAYLETVQLLTQTNIVDIPAWLGHTQASSRNGQNTKLLDYKPCVQQSELQPIRDMERVPVPVKQPAIPNLEKFLPRLNQTAIKKLSRWNGLIELLQKDLLGGTWTTVPLTLPPQEVLKFSYIQKDIPQKKTRLLLLGLQKKDIPQQANTIQGAKQAKLTTTSTWERILAENGSQNSSNSLFPQWNTNLEKVESVHLAGVEPVYDIEVEDNHNFVANGLLVHNCHMLSTQAFNALLKTLEEPPKHIVFILATTDPQRVLPTIISRCQRFDFRRIPLESLVKHLTYISIQENISISADAITLIAQLSQGGLRDAESLLDQLSLLSGEVTPDKVWDLVGTVSEKDLFGLLSAIASDNSEVVIDSTRKILDRGREPLIVLQNLAGFYRDLLIAKTAPNRGDLVACTQETWLSLVQFSQKLSINNILVGQQHLRSAEVQLKNTTQPRLWLEVTILGLLPSAQQQQVITTNIAPVSNHSTNNYQPVNQQPANQQPVNQQPVNQQPVNQQPVNQQPVNQQPVNQQPVNQQPVNQQPANQQPVNQPSLTNNHEDLTQVWQQVLSHLDPVSRRELLRQMCHVIELQEKTARLGIKQAWFKRVQADLPIITAAFRSAFQREIRVDLEVANSIHPKQASGDKSQQNGSTRQVTPPNSFAGTSVPPTTPPTTQPIPESPPPVNQAFQPNQQVTPNNESFVPNHVANNGNGNGNNYGNTNGNGINRNGNNGNGSNGNGSNGNNGNGNNGNGNNGNGSNGNGSNINANNYVNNNGNGSNGNGNNGVQNGSIPEPQPQANIAPITPIEPIINDGMAEKLLYAAERLADFFDGKVIGFSEDDSDFGDFGTSPELMEIVDGDED